MRIWFAPSKFEMDDRVKEEMKAHDKLMMERGGFTYINVPVHLARYPHSCEDCGGTYWASEERYYFHKGCPSKKRDMGF